MSQLPHQNSDSQQPDTNSSVEYQAKGFNVDGEISAVQGNSNRAIQGHNNRAVQGDSNQVIQGNNNQVSNIYNTNIYQDQQEVSPIKKLTQQLKNIQQYRKEYKWALLLMISGYLVIHWFIFPLFSNIYNSKGLNNYHEKKFKEAKQDYLKAISLNADNIEAHYNLGNLYEDWQELEKAKKEYQIAVAGNLPDAYNNLGRLYIQEKKYPEAVNLLVKGLLLTKEKNSYPEVRYKLFKNLSWVRFEQGRYEDARLTLQAAIGISTNPEAANYINPGSAHCLLAQVLDKQKQPTALEQWQKCCQLGSWLNLDEDPWLHLSQEKLSKAGRRCTNLEN